VIGAALLALGVAAAEPVGDAGRGEILAGLGLCEACHTAPGGAPYAGGYRIVSDFGDWIGPNISPDYKTGLGAWEYADFEAAMRRGRAPSGRAYAPSFPYPWFTALSDQDLADLWAFLRTVPATERANEPHEVPARYRWRLSMGVWRLLYFDAGPAEPPTDALERGAYWVEGLGHCGACHTPRNALGAPRRDLAFTGGDPPHAGPDLTAARMSLWTPSDWETFLRMGMDPGGDFVGGPMGHLIEHGTAKLPDEDVRAIVGYFRALPP
jgi:mono/diheme cytochrome c family protein